MPISFEQVRETFQKKLSSASYLTEKFLESFKKVFSVNLEDDITISNYRSKLAVAFKRKINVNEDNLTFTTSYAAYVLSILANQMPPSSELKADPITIRDTILETYGTVNIETCLDFIWRLNIAVIPLNFHSSFHGACFDLKARRQLH